MNTNIFHPSPTHIHRHSGASTRARTRSAGNSATHQPAHTLPRQSAAARMHSVHTPTGDTLSLSHPRSLSPRPRQRERDWLALREIGMRRVRAALDSFLSRLEKTNGERDNRPGEPIHIYTSACALSSRGPRDPSLEVYYLSP